MENESLKYFIEANLNIMTKKTFIMPIYLLQVLQQLFT
jgi:hypothetical protein